MKLWPLRRITYPPLLSISVCILYSWDHPQNIAKIEIKIITYIYIKASFWDLLEAPKIIGLALLQHVIKVTYNRVVNNYTTRKNFIYNLEKQNKSIGINLLKHTLIMLKHNNFDHFNDLHKYELYWIYRYLSILLWILLTGTLKAMVKDH